MVLGVVFRLDSIFGKILLVGSIFYSGDGIGKLVVIYYFFIYKIVFGIE